MAKWIMSAGLRLTLIAMSVYAGLIVPGGTGAAEAAGYNSCIMGCAEAQNNCRASQQDSRMKKFCATYNVNACQQGCKQSYRMQR